MNLKYLGDALDHWKGSLFELLLSREVLWDFAVDPMASDLELWQEADFELFAELLRIPRERIVPHTVGLAQRSRYFAEIGHSGDLFLDPDTGVATGLIRAPQQYVYPREIGQLLGVGLNRLVVVYQHVRARKVSDRVDEVLRFMAAEYSAVNWCSYESGTVAMLFLSLAPHRTHAVAEAFRTKLGRHAADRIRGGSPVHAA